MRTNPVSPPVIPPVHSEGKKKHVEKEPKQLSNPVAYEKATPQSEQFGTYKVDQQKIAQLKNDFNRNTESFKAMVRSMIEKQGKVVSDVLKAINSGEEVFVEVDKETQLAAQEAISENGYWGVEQTATRILDFAKAISGGDPSKIDLLINAVKEGFEAAKEIFGGKLPEISQKTYDRVMEGFEAWKNES